MRKLVGVFLVLAVTLLTGPAAPVRADDASVGVGDFDSYVVAKGKKATVTPVVVTSGAVTVRSATFTIRKGTKTVVANKKRAKLGAGTYQVTTTISWQATGSDVVQTTQATKTLKISTFKSATARAQLATSLIADHLATPKVAQKIAAGASPSVYTLKRNRALDKIAQQWASNDAAKGKFTKRSQKTWKKLNAYFDVWDLWEAGVNPYQGSLGAEAAATITDRSGSPLQECGAPTQEGVDSCEDGINWAYVGVGVAISKKGVTFVNVIVATPKG